MSRATRPQIRTMPAIMAQPVPAISPGASARNFWPQPGHFTFLPKRLSGTRSCRPQSGHVTISGMVPRSVVVGVSGGRRGASLPHNTDGRGRPTDHAGRRFRPNAVLRTEYSVLSTEYGVRATKQWQDRRPRTRVL